MNKLFWLPIGVLALLLLFALVSYLGGPGPSGPMLTKRQEKSEQGSIAKQHQRARGDTLASAALTKRAERTQDAIKPARQQAIALHRQSKRHAQPVLTTATGLDSLQEFLAHYGDRPSPAHDER